MKKSIYLFAFLLLIGCKDEYKECRKGSPFLYTAGYDSTEIDSIQIVQFEKGSNFSKKLSENYFLFFKSLTRKLGEDSFFISYPSWEPYLEEYDNFDWRYTVLSDGSTYNITEAKRKINKTSIDHPNGACTSPIVSLKVNGTFQSDEEGIRYFWIIKP